MNVITRRALFAASAAVATGLGIGVGWQRWRPQAAASGSEAQLWGQSLNTPDGMVTALSKWRGKPTLVNFWATWCPPCIKEMPMLDAFFLAHQDRCNILGLAVDQAKAVQGFLNKQSIHYPILLTGAKGVNLAKALGNEAGGLPFSVFLDSAGTITHTQIGKLTEEDMDRWQKSFDN